LQSIFNKFGVGSRIEAVTLALKRGWLILADLSYWIGAFKSLPVQF